MDIRIRRAYDKMADDDGYRVLVDRLWPRGVAKEELKLDDWCKEIAPSNELRKWFGHDPAKWEEFQHRFRKELDENAAVASLVEQVKEGRVTLVFAAKDEAHNNAVVLRDYLRDKAG